MVFISPKKLSCAHQPEKRSSTTDIDIFPTSTGRIDILDLEARHRTSGCFFNLLRRDAQIHDTSVSDFKTGDISGCVQQRAVRRHECDVIFQVTLAKVSVLNKTPAKCWDDCIPV